MTNEWIQRVEEFENEIRLIRKEVAELCREFDKIIEELSGK